MTDRQLEFHLPAPPAGGDVPLIPARMVNEFAYCPRLAYLMWTQGEWAETGDTVEGRRVHARVDRPGAPLPPPQAIADARRWRRVFKTMHGYGEWLQLSVFQCRLTRRRRAELETRLRELIRNGEDHVLVIDVGPADRIELAMASIGRTVSKMERRATVI